MFIYLITSPHEKHYVGKATVTVERKIQYYIRESKKIVPNNRSIIRAIRKYGWENMKFRIIEIIDDASLIDSREQYWISYYNSYECGYNQTKGGDGIDSETASMLNYKREQSAEWSARKDEISKKCSAGQKKRYANMSDSLETREKKRISHNGRYKIIAPDGREWETLDGLKGFAEAFKDEIDITYWQLFNAYRNNYSDMPASKSPHKWKVFRLDK